MAAANFKFSKMHGLGNDFMMINAVDQSFTAQPEQIRAWANRHTGVGFDQCIVVTPATGNETDFVYHIYNADGNEVEQCGNGARCVAEFIHLQGLSQQSRLRLATPFDHLTAERLQPGLISLQFAAPKSVQCQQSLSHRGETLTYTDVQLANPHAVLLVDEVAVAPVATLGGELAQHSRFTQGCNIEFVQVVSPERVRVRVRERGVGETLACGTGAIAAVVACAEMGRVAQEVTVSLPGGELLIAWAGQNTAITMTGPAVMVYDGKISF